MIRAICTNNKNCPEDFPDKSLWLKENKQYTIIRVHAMMLQEGILGVQLNEIDMDGIYPYYGWFKASRFAINKSDLEELENLIKASAEELEVSINLDEIINPLEFV